MVRVVYKVPNLSPADRVNRFEFEVPRRHWWQFRTTFSIPFLQFVPIELIKEHRKADKPLQMTEIAKAIGEPAAARAILRLNLPELAQLEHAWLEESAVGLGELSAS